VVTRIEQRVITSQDEELGGKFCATCLVGLVVGRPYISLGAITGPIVMCFSCVSDAHKLTVKAV
jgi:hypothetical protein